MSSSAKDTPYSLCKMIVNLFNKLFSTIPSLKSILTNELNQMVSKIIESNNRNPSANNKIFLDVLIMLGNDTPLDSITDFFPRLSDDSKLYYLLKNGNKFNLDSKAIKDLFYNRIESLAHENSLNFIYQNQIEIIQLIRTLEERDLLDMFRNLKTKIIENLKVIPLDKQGIHDLIEVALIIIIAFNYNSQVFCFI